jgi:rhodanese-related sulfurtransferase
VNPVNRIVIIGDGYQAGKAFRTAQRIHPKADLVWISDYDDQKYSLPMISLLLKSGAKMNEWSRIRARIKVEFERYQQIINLLPQRVKKIKIDLNESEISFLTGMGKMSYSFDKVLVFPAKTVEYHDKLQDNHYVWPADSSVQFLVDNWESIENPVVAGSDLSLVQAMIQGGRKCLWIRTDTTFTPQIQYFLDQRLEQAGVKILPALSENEFQEILKNAAEELGKQPVFFCGHVKTDYERLEGYGLKDLDVSQDNPELPGEKKVVLIDGSGLDNINALGFSPESELAYSLNMVEAALAGDEYINQGQSIMYWNMGALSAAKTGLNMAEARGKGFTPEFALVHGAHGIFADKPYALNMIMDKPTKKILGLEAVGEKALEWANLAACFSANSSTVPEILTLDIVWPDLVINPLTRCARMLENKTHPAILGITPDELKQSADDGAEFFLLDVRKKEEFALGRIPGASNIPLNQLKKRIMDIPRFTPIVLYSQCSGRAYEAARLLKNMGARQLYVLDGGFGLYTLDKDFSPLSQSQTKVSKACPSC